MQIVSSLPAFARAERPLLSENMPNSASRFAKKQEPSFQGNNASAVKRFVSQTAKAVPFMFAILGNPTPSSPNQTTRPAIKVQAAIENSQPEKNRFNMVSTVDTLAVPTDSTGTVQDSLKSQSDIPPIPEDAPRYKTRTTVFCPEDPTVDRAMQGGMVDRIGRSIENRSLEAYLEGKGDYVVIAMDKKAFPYGTTVRIPELEERFGRMIIFKIVGTGGAFKGKGTSRIDIMTRRLKGNSFIAGRQEYTMVVIDIPKEKWKHKH